MTQPSSSPQPNIHNAAPTQFMDIGDTQLAYRRFGKQGQPPVVYFQHFNGNMNNWDPVHTNRLAQEREVVLVDYRGVGRSGGETPTSIEAIAADSAEFIRRLNTGAVHLLGFSMGGFVAQQVALDAPELVKSLILAGTGPRAGEGMQQFSPRVTEILARPGVTQGQQALELFFQTTPTSQAAGQAWLERISERQTDREPDNKPQVAAAQYQALGAWGQLPANPDERYRYLARISQPTLVVNGSDDIMVPSINSFILQQYIPTARLVLFPDSGHGGHFQFAPEFAELAAHFLRDGHVAGEDSSR